MNPAELYTYFKTGMSLFPPASPEENNILAGLATAFKAIQDHVTGIPIYATETQSLLLYEDLAPQKIECDSPVPIGALLNLYFIGTPAKLKARQATSLDPLRFCNAIALSPPDSKGRVLVGMGTSFVSGVYEKSSQWLSSIPGEKSNTLRDHPIAKIVQKLGEADTSGFYYTFHSPTFTSSTQFIALKDGND